MPEESLHTLLGEVSAFLGVSPDSLAPTDAISRLVAFQRTNHPDHFQDHDAHRQATERFKQAGVLLQRLRTFIEKSLAQGTASTAIVPASHLDIIRLEAEVSQALARTADATAQLRDTRFHVDVLKRENSELKTALANRRQAAMSSARERLVKPYKPTAKTFVAISLAAGLTILMTTLGQVEEVVRKVLAPSGLTTRDIGFITFLSFLITVLLATRGYFRAQALHREAARLHTTRTLRAFAARVSSRRSGAAETGASAAVAPAAAMKRPPALQFTEEDVVEFLEAELAPRGVARRILTWLGFRSFSQETINDLKDLMLAHMIEANYIETGPIDGLQRLFRVRPRPSYDAWTLYHDVLPEAGGEAPQVRESSGEKEGPIRSESSHDLARLARKAS